jgi:hypothetical protein
VTSNGRGGWRYRPFAFTNQGVAMLLSVLRTPRARSPHRHHAHLCPVSPHYGLQPRDRPQDRGKEKNYDEQFAVVLDAIKQFVAEDAARKSSAEAPDRLPSLGNTVVARRKRRGPGEIVGSLTVMTIKTSCQVIRSHRL